MFGVIFDKNGVIIDDMPYHRKAWREFAERHGATLTDDEFNRELNGRRNPDTLRYVLKKELSELEIKTLAAEKESIYFERYGPHRRLTPGLQEFFDSLKENRVPMAIATSAPRENVAFILDGLNIRHYFNAVIDADDVINGKPDPEIFLRAADSLGIPADCCVVFEDSLLGIVAANRSGMKAVGVATSHTREELIGAVDVISDFSEMNFERIKSIFAGAPRTC